MKFGWGGGGGGEGPNTTKQTNGVLTIHWHAKSVCES